MKRSLRVALVTGMVFLSSCGSQPAAADIGTGYRKGYLESAAQEGPRKPRVPRKPVVRAAGVRSAPQVRGKAARRIVRPAVKKKVAAPILSGSVQARIAAAWPGNDHEAIEIVRCETGGTFNPTIHNPSRRYHGLWQADSSFSRTYAGVTDAHVLSVEAQTKMAWRAYSSGRGYRPWPHCGARRFGSR